MAERYKWSEALVQLCVKATNGSICCMQRQQFLSPIPNNLPISAHTQSWS